MMDSAIANPYTVPVDGWMETFNPFDEPENPLFSMYPPLACSPLNLNCRCAVE